MYLGDHLVDVISEFVYAYLLCGGNEYARNFPVVYPLVFQLVELQVPVGLRLK